MKIPVAIKVLREATSPKANKEILDVGSPTSFAVFHSNPSFLRKKMMLLGNDADHFPTGRLTLVCPVIYNTCNFFVANDNLFSSLLENVSTW